ncbi:hypothetical protein [Ralstonia solanacearum]|uniref:hypothetical protein n=1 Tax=Ralstonia solanacearum TaxID=305 RepID=UPI0018C206AB|nr:hypothetical protein [Ralstonia solanacearum]
MILIIEFGFHGCQLLRIAAARVAIRAALMFPNRNIARDRMANHGIATDAPNADADNSHD